MPDICCNIVTALAMQGFRLRLILIADAQDD